MKALSLEQMALLLQFMMMMTLMALMAYPTCSDSKLTRDAGINFQPPAGLTRDVGVRLSSLTRRILVYTPTPKY